MKVLKTIVCLLVIVAVAGNVNADEKKKKGKGNQRTPKVTQRFVAKMELSDDQKTQVAEIDKTFAPKLAELNKKKEAILTKEQIEAETAAKKAARAEKKTGAEARKAVQDAVSLTDEQKTKMKEVTAAQQTMNKEVIAALKKVLTEEQQAKLPKIGGKKGGAKAGEKKKKNKDAA